MKDQVLATVDEICSDRELGANQIQLRAKRKKKLRLSRSYHQFIYAMILFIFQWFAN